MEHLVHNLDQFHLIDQGIRTHNVAITLVELPVTSLLRTIGTPNRLDLVTFERKTDLITMLYHVTGERNGQIITQAFLTSLSSKSQRVLFH